MDNSFSAVFVGTSFASMFFLKKYLEKKPDAKVLLLERGDWKSHAWQKQQQRHSTIHYKSTYYNSNDQKDWYFSLGVGGTSKCWTGCTPRFMPNDFQMRSRYNVGMDWPLRYDDLEEYYEQAESIMAVSGPAETPFPRQNPYPQPPHNMSDPDRILQKAWPGLYFAQPCARARVATKNRPKCCASGICSLCPIDSKFTILNEMHDLLRDPRVDMLVGANVHSFETGVKDVKKVRFILGNKKYAVNSDLFVLGANAVFNPFIMLQSGMRHDQLGANLCEQVSLTVNVMLDGVDNFQGSTSVTSNGYVLYDGPHRHERAGCMIESFNVPLLRMERGKWRQRLRLKFIFENLPEEKNKVIVSSINPSKPETIFNDHSDYAKRGMDYVKNNIDKILSPLPADSISILPESAKTEYHIAGTVQMGDSPQTSVVDQNLTHHQYRNLVVAGSSAFPTVPPANPTLTIAALSLRSADKLLKSGA